ncbi:MAG: hypothetical protein HOM80_13475, partial [Bacteroidetes bacterium]|nr:hypothetical protein [Bacteroidota bacterium]
MNKLVLIIALVATSVYTYAQELITDRPDQTESAQVVPLHSLQIESGYVFETKIQLGEKTITANSTLLRYGIIKDFELRLGVDYSIYTPKTGAAKLKGFNPIYGARPLRRAVMRLLEDNLAGEFLAGESLTPGTT